MTGQSTAQRWELVAALVIGIGVCLIAPLSTALEFGPDEGYELMKALLIYHGYGLYQEVWSDQPPLYTYLMVLVFSLFGPSACAARALSVSFAVLLIFSFYQVVRGGSGRFVGIIAVVLLVSSSFSLQLTVSAMLELPAISLAMLSLWTSELYLPRRRKIWLLVSAVLFACALQTKLTAALYTPAILSVCLGPLKQTFSPSLPTRWSFWNRIGGLTIWCCTAFVIFGAILLGFYESDTLSVFLTSHSHPAVQIASDIGGITFRVSSLFEHLAAPLAILAVLASFRTRPQNMLCPLLLFLTALCVHLVVRPYWYYYDIHFAIPIAWLGAIGLSEWFRIMRSQVRHMSQSTSLSAQSAYAGMLLLLAFFCVALPSRMVTEVRRLSGAAKAPDDPCVQALRALASRGRWIFTDRVIYAFWAELLVPPELAVIPLKRRWSGIVTKEYIVDCLERYRPQCIVLSSDAEADLDLSDYITRYYRLAPTPPGFALYVRK